MIAPTHKGAGGELIACAWLLEQGFEVFRNVSGCGPADLIAWRVADNQIFKIDVKVRNALAEMRNGGFTLAARAAEGMDVHMLFVTGGEVVGFFRARNGAPGAELYDPFSSTGDA